LKRGTEKREERERVVDPNPVQAVRPENGANEDERGRKRDVKPSEKLGNQEPDEENDTENDEAVLRDFHRKV